MKYAREGTRSPYFPYYMWVSDHKKKANNYALARDVMDHYDLSTNIETDRVRKIQENFDIHGGRWPAIESMNPDLILQLGAEEITLGSGKLHHYPLMDRVSTSIVSDMQMRPLIPVIRDTSSKARSHRERIQLERVISYFYNTEVQPRIQQITAQYDQQNGVRDLASLPIEAQRQRQFDIDRRFKEETPEEILNYLERLRTPDELVSENLLKEALRYTKARVQFDIGAENAVVTAEEYYRLDTINNMPYLEALNPKWVVWGGSEHCMNVEDGNFAVYKQHITLEEAIIKYAHHWKNGDIKKLLDLYSPIPSEYKGDAETGRHRRNLQGIEQRVVDVFKDNPHLQAEIDPKTREGQEKLKQIYQQVGGYSREGFGIPETFITWKWYIKGKLVTRVINGVLETFIRDEHYEKNPLKGDIKVEEIPIPQSWKGIKLGQEFYIDVKPLDYQHNNIYNPFDTKLAIYGGKYNTFQNNSKNSSFIDLGKPWNYRYNVLMKKMEEHQATDIGKIMLGTTTMLPKGWTWAQWYKSIFMAKTAIISNHREGITSMDADIFRSIDMSRTVDIGSDVQQLEYFENKCIRGMHYSPQKIGEISQYSTNQNAQLQIAGVDRQLYRFYNRNRRIKENVLTGLLQLSLHVFKDNEQVKSMVLDDFLKAHYELNFNQEDLSNFTLHVVDDFAETEKLQQMKSLALTFLQNGMTAGQLGAIQAAESVSEMTQLLEDIDTKNRRSQEEEFARQESLVQQQNESLQMQQKLQQEFMQMEAERERQTKIRLAEINSMLLMNANDVDNNKVNDSLQKAMMEIESQERMQREKFNHETMINEMDLEVEREKIKSSNTKK